MRWLPCCSRCHAAVEGLERPWIWAGWTLHFWQPHCGGPHSRQLVMQSSYHREQSEGGCSCTHAGSPKQMGFPVRRHARQCLSRSVLASTSKPAEHVQTTPGILTSEVTGMLGMSSAQPSIVSSQKWYPEHALLDTVLYHCSPLLFPLSSPVTRAAHKHLWLSQGPSGAAATPYFRGGRASIWHSHPHRVHGVNLNPET